MTWQICFISLLILRHSWSYGAPSIPCWRDIVYLQDLNSGGWKTVPLLTTLKAYSWCKEQICFVLVSATGLSSRECNEWLSLWSWLQVFNDREVMCSVAVYSSLLHCLLAAEDFNRGIMWCCHLSGMMLVAIIICSTARHFVMLLSIGSLILWSSMKVLSTAATSRIRTRDL